MSLDLLHEFSTVAVDPNEPLFTEPLARSVANLAATRSEVVLLGSIATAKYVDCLLPILGDRLLFPSEKDGWMHLYSISAEGGSLTALTPGEFEVEHVSASADGREISADRLDPAVANRDVGARQRAEPGIDGDDGATLDEISAARNERTRVLC